MIKRRTFRILVLLALVLGVLYYIGPRPSNLDITGTIPPMRSDLEVLDHYVTDKEYDNKDIKPNNESRIIWHEGEQKKTEYALLYLPGFSGSYYEAEPLHRELGAEYGMNVYLARLQAHGMDKKEAMLEFDASKYVQSAREALSIAQSIGDKVIIMSTSTGGTLALILAAENPDIHALINYSPNIDLYDSRSWMLTIPWGLQIARIVEGGKYHIWSAGPMGERYWNEKYRLESLVELKFLLENTMNKNTFSKIKQPMFVGTFYKNSKVHDKVVSVTRVKDMYDQIGTDITEKIYVEYPMANTHVIACQGRSSSFENVKFDTQRFMEQILKINPLK